MRRIIILTAAVLCLFACGKTPTTGNNEATKRFFDAWIYVQKQKHPEYLWKQTGLGSWILEQTEGKGPLLGTFEDSTYIRVNYTQYLEDGTISASTSKIIAQQLGSYDETVYYGPQTMYGKGIFTGLQEIIAAMRDGGKVKVIIPAWLATYNQYDTAEEYLDQKSDDIGVTSVYEIELLEHFYGIEQWSADSVGRYLVKTFPSRYGTNPVKAVADSAGAFGFYYVQTKAPASRNELKDTTVYINYTGRLLNGLVFDTTIRDTAIFYGLSRDKTYEPVSITISEGWSGITMGDESTSVIQGFARTIAKMKAGEAGTGVFIPSLGYGYKGSGNSIPAYAPLRFDVELVDKE
jgi:FKBP-type peptidyl-prolyl cis-trans isomerase